MAELPPIVERCQTCGAELPSAAPLCWLCRTPRGQKQALVAAAPAAPSFVMAGNIFSYGMILGCGLLLALMCFGMMADSQDNFLPAIILGAAGGIPLFATLVRTVTRHQQSGSASFLDTLLTLLAYSAIAAGLLVLLAFAAVGALVIWCFWALANNKF
jgi:small-conductance mechanosensitive channel